MCYFLLNLILIFSLYLGDDSGKVTIWNMAPVKNEEDEMNENVPKLLCQMDNHLGIEHTSTCLLNFPFFSRLNLTC